MIRRVLVSVLALIAVLAASGCDHAVDDEMVPPLVTETAAPQPPTDLPDLPVGAVGLTGTERVTVTGSVIQVGGRRVDVAPMRVDAHVVTAGGIYFVNAGELWFTDLARVRATPFVRVEGLRLSPDGRRLLFTDLEHGAPGEDGTPMPVEVEYDVRDGHFLAASYANGAPA